MRYIDEFRDPGAARTLIREIEGLLEALAPPRPLQIMEFCGGHTHAIFRYGLHQMLPEAVEWIHGPGCPVCVLPRERIDKAISLALDHGVTLTCFGDVLRVPGTAGSLLEARGRGADVRIVYSPLDSLALAKALPEREVVFFAIGFETTAPATAFTVLQADKESLANFSLLCQHVTTPSAIRALLGDPELRLDGILAPGHVSTVLGSESFRFIADEYHLPVVVSGFEPLDLLQSLWMLLVQIREGRCTLENQYGRVARKAGSLAAKRAIARVFEPAPSASWRGLGEIPASSLRLRGAYAGFDAERRFALNAARHIEDPAPCGEVLKGRMRPGECPFFACRCNPENPLGALMVSSEGACAAWYRYGGRT